MTAPRQRKRHPTLADDVGELWRRIVLQEELHTPAGRQTLHVALAVTHAVLYRNGCWSEALRDLETAVHLVHRPPLGM